MRRLPIVLSMIMLLVAHTPATAQSQSDPVQTEDAISVGDTAESDIEIQRRLSGLMSKMAGFSNVDVSVSEGVVRFSGQVIDNAMQEQLTQIADRVDGVIAIENQTEVSGSLEERLSPALERITNRSRNVLANTPIFLVAVSAFLAIAVGGWLLTTRLGIWARLAPNQFIADIYRAVARILFIVLGAVLALDILNATALIGAVLGAAGVVGLALGFAVRDTVENFIASVLLSLRQPFRPNDLVDIQGDIGTIARLTSRATILISPEGNHIRIPNATVYKGRIVNYTRDPRRRFSFDLGVDADADQAAALTTGLAALRNLDFVLDDPEVGAWVSEVGDSNVVLTFTGWVDQSQTNFSKARGEAIRMSKNALESAGFGLPEPIYRVRLDDGSGVGQRLRSAEGASTAPVGPKQASTNADLPPESDPSQLEHAIANAADRERSQQDGDENLLDARRQSE